MAQTQALSAAISVEALRLAIVVFVNKMGCALSAQSLSERHAPNCSGMTRARLPFVQCTGSGKGNRPWGYHVPDGDTWQDKVDARLGIKH